MATPLGGSRIGMLLRFAAAIALCSAVCVEASQTDRQSELRDAFSAARQVQTRGPSDIKLADQAVLRLPSGFVYIPENEGGRVLTAMGNRVGEGLLGLVFPEGKDEWFVSLRLIKSGFIKDEEAKDWKVDELLANIKAGTEEVNKERKARGIPEMEILGWVEPPVYERSTHRLVWALSSKHKGEPDSTERGVNYNTYALGRDGYISLNLVTDMSAIQSYKPVAHRLLGALDYNEGKRYADFNASSDHVAEYGLAALIGGVAAKKLGLLAVIAAFAAKFAKVIGIAAIALFASWRKLLGRKKSEAPATPPAN